MPELDEKKRIIEYDTVNDPDENYYALIDNGTAGTGKVSIKGLGPADMISDQYSDSSTYKVGDLCIHNNKLYVCTVAINTPHAFNLSEWELDTLGNYTSQIKQSLSNLTEVVKDYRTTPVGYNGGGRIFIQKMGNTCIIRFVDYIPKSPTGLQLLTDLPFNMKSDNSNIIFNASSGQYKILLSGNKIYSYYNADMSTNTNVFNGQVIGFITI